MKEDIEITIYLNKLKFYMKKNPDVSEYFFNKNNQDDFYALVTLFAKENLEKNEDPSLDISQFEEIRLRLGLLNVKSTVPSSIQNFYFSLN